ncbi:MAG: porin family protein [Bacteroidota bacterium]
MKRRISFIAALALCTLFSQAQKKAYHPGGITFGVRAGVNFQNVNGKDDLDRKLKNHILPGINIGVNVEIPVAPDFYLQPGLLFSTKGGDYQDNNDGSVKISYIELPFNFLYKPLLGKGHMLLGFGPYVAFGVGGSNGSRDIKFKNTVALSDPDDVAYYRPIDAGANMLVGYEFSNKISFQLNTQLGLTKINPDDQRNPNDQRTERNTGFGFSAGYRF